jgi:hypothetical protein
MAAVFVLLLLAGTPPQSAGEMSSALEHAQSWEQFLSGVATQRDLWLKNAARASVSPSLVERLKRVGNGLRLVIVAEDWCTDSVNTVPFITKLAAAAHVDIRIIDRAVGAPIMNSHRTADGRAVTPTVVFVRDGQDVGAWVERPAALQKMFSAMGRDAESRQRFAQRQSWYDADRGMTTLAEIVALAERTAVNR